MYHFHLIPQISEEEEFLIWRTRLWRDESMYDRSFVIWDLFVFIFEHCDLACNSRRNKHMQFLMHFFGRYLPSHHSTSFSAARNIQKLTCFLNDSLIIFHFSAVYYLAAAATMLWCCGKLDPTTTVPPLWTRDVTKKIERAERRPKADGFHFLLRSLLTREESLSVWRKSAYEEHVK